MSRLLELIQAVNRKYPNDDFYQSFEKDLRENYSKKESLYVFNDALTILDDDSWLILKERVLESFKECRIGQKKQAFFNQLNEAFAYQHLASLGYTNIKILAENGKNKTPDISYTASGKELYCEVKTLGISDDEIARRSSVGYVDRSMYCELSDEYFNKLNYHLIEAQSQIKSQGLVFIVIRFDDFTGTNQDRYREQITSFINNHSVSNIFIKFEQGYESIYKNSNP